MEKSFNHHHHHHEGRQEFARVVAPLEEAAGRRLGNPQRQKCFEAFEKYPEGVREVARGALADTDGRNAVGLFFYRIANGWHELEPLPAGATNRCGCSHPECRFQDVCQLADKDAA